jgi:hypothetical protein
MAGAGWFIYSLYRWDNKMDWQTALPLGNALLGDLFDWLKKCPNGNEMLRTFKRLMKMEAMNEFKPNSSKRLLEVISHVSMREKCERESDTADQGNR